MHLGLKGKDSKMKQHPYQLETVEVTLVGGKKKLVISMDELVGLYQTGRIDAGEFHKAQSKF
jgi:hypothetical protein